MNKISVQMLQINNSYGNNVFIPYSVGIIRAYSEKDRLIKDNFEFRPFIYKRDSVAVLADRIGKADIVCLSCYIWNWSLNMALAAEIRRRNDNCLIIAGGPQVPDNIDGFFEKHPYLDIAVHGEGEETFYQVLKTYINKGSFGSIEGLSYHERVSGQVFRNEMRPKIPDLNDIPSPYLNGIFKDLVEDERYVWIAMWETNRGCPFTCSYCDWGTGSKKLRMFEMDRLYEEIEWLGKNKIQFVFGCDSNFGMFKRDITLIERLTEMKRTIGYPLTFRVCNTKNSNETVFNIEKALNEAGMSKGASLSMQSLSDEVLKNIKRHNMKIDMFFKLQTRYKENGMSTYTELILPLPGETYRSFVDGLTKLLENGQHSQLNIYNCTIMVNSEMGQKSYQEEFGIKTVKIPIFQAHSSMAGSDDDIVEYEEIVIETAAMPVSDWRRSFRFAWAVQCFHFLGVLQPVAILLYGRYNIKYGAFYEGLIQYGIDNPETFIGQELTILDGILDNVLKGIGFDQYLREFGEVTWPAEEATFLRLSDNIPRFYQETADFLKELLFSNDITPEDDLVTDLLNYQRARLVNYNDNELSGSSLIRLDLNYNIPEYVDMVMSGTPSVLKQRSEKYVIARDKNFNGDKKIFARDVVWYGRKGGKFLYNMRKENAAGCREQ